MSRYGTKEERDERMRGRRLQEERARWFSAHPLCARCKAKGRTSLAVQLDHIVPLFKGGPDFHEPGGEENKQGLCSPCHAEKTALDLGYVVQKRIGADGFPVE